MITLGYFRLTRNEERALLVAAYVALLHAPIVLGALMLGGAL